jgi:hypothetical protein
MLPQILNRKADKESTEDVSVCGGKMLIGGQMPVTKKINPKILEL